MATNHSWDFLLLEVAPTLGGHSDVVVTVHWTYLATQSGLTVSESGQTTVPFDPDAPFTPYGQLTSADIAAWVSALVDMEALDARLDGRIAAEQAPASLTAMVPPWAA